MKPLQFRGKDDLLFYETLKKKVKEYFIAKGESEKGNRKLYWKTIILFTLWGAAYTTLLLSSFSVWLTIGMYLMLGALSALIGFNVMHDGGHGSYSNKKRVNTLMGYSMNLLGSDIFLRKVQHNVLHHTYTNVVGYDDDIDSWPVFRFHPEQKKKRFHRYQHLYCLPLYAFSVINKMFQQDFSRYFKSRVGQFSFPKMKPREHFIFRGTKLLMVTIYYLLPALLVGPIQALIGIVVMYGMMGVFLSVVFQLAHVIEKTQMPSHDEDNVIQRHRAVHEIMTTANFAMKNKVRTWLLGGLNFQIEHHLFPMISHVHYPEIAPIVQQICEQFNIPYYNYRSVPSAFISHIRYLKQMGT